MDEDLLNIIRDVQFLHDFPDDYLKPLASVATLKDYAPGAFVFREGQKNSRLYLIVKGSVSLEFCTPGLGCKRLQTVGAGRASGLVAGAGPERHDRDGAGARAHDAAWSWMPGNWSRSASTIPGSATSSCGGRPWRCRSGCPPRGCSCSTSFITSFRSSLSAGRSR